MQFCIICLMSTSKLARTLSCSNQALSFEPCVFCQLAGMSNGFFVYNSINLFKLKHGSLIQDNSPSTVYFTDTQHRSVICTSGLIATNNSCLWSLWPVGHFEVSCVNHSLDRVPIWLQQQVGWGTRLIILQSKNEDAHLYWLGHFGEGAPNSAFWCF